MKNIQSFDSFLSEAETAPKSTEWGKNLGDIPGLTRTASTKSPMVSWKLMKDSKPVWRIFLREKEGDIQLATTAYDSKAFNIASKIHNELEQELKSASTSSEPFQSLKDKSVLPGGLEEAGYGVITLKPENLAMAFEVAKKVIAKHPESTK